MGRFRIILPETVAEFEHRSFEVRKTSRLSPFGSDCPSVDGNAHVPLLGLPVPASVVLTDCFGGSVIACQLTADGSSSRAL